ncbi:MAG: hypothetical protein UCO57_15560 [Gemmiger sp.]|uniref:hypothetical protein n=1 Tax=Gemmiger sp. TaxID=2049027 RepID=UPI0026661C50|nr:hypothetical protein [Gemmiger sp.]MEE0710178.1 hypothetical protein [Gemmiger sp.]
MTISSTKKGNWKKIPAIPGMPRTKKRERNRAARKKAHKNKEKQKNGRTKLALKSKKIGKAPCDRWKNMVKFPS